MLLTHLLRGCHGRYFQHLRRALCQKRAHGDGQMSIHQKENTGFVIGRSVMLGPARPVVNNPENSDPTAGKWGNGDDSQGENPLVQRHAHDGLTGTWRDKSIAQATTELGTGASCHCRTAPKMSMHPGQVILRDKAFVSLN